MPRNRTINSELKQMCRRNRDGSFATQRDRTYLLQLCANQLGEMGFGNLSAGGLKPKHIERLVARWQADGLTAGTIKNRMSALRWWAEKVSKQNVVARQNRTYGIAARCYVTNENKSRTFIDGNLGLVSDPYSLLSLRLQAAFGLRREESIKICPAWADRGDCIALKGSWTKGGRPREIPIRNDEQRALLTAAKELAGAGSLIPPDKSYVQQLRRFEHQCAQAGIQGGHGLRHQYAQTRYHELTGWPAPANGGPKSRQLSFEQRQIDRAARLTISRELGHEREQITAVYVGR